MHDIEPYYSWRDRYTAETDERSPFFGRTYNEFTYSTRIYNYYLHPQWDEFGSPTLYTKLLFTDYDQQFAVLEFIGEWNDCTHNDIMFLKRDVIDPLIREGVCKFMLVCENVLNLHASDDDYYQEWHDDIIDEGGWIMALNIREHVSEEWDRSSIYRYLLYGPEYNDIPWRRFQPEQLLLLMEDRLMKRLTV